MFKKLLIATALLLTTVSCNHSMLGQTSSPSTNPGKPSYLFVIMSDYGMIQQTSNGEYQLILDHSDVEKVLAFTNRPYRLVQHETGEALKTMWSGGSNSFADDPPNATVIINQHLQTVILTSMSVQGDKTILRYSPMALIPSAYVRSLSDICRWRREDMHSFWPVGGGWIHANRFLRGQSTALILNLKK